jgi:peptidoglycan hydrolase-like protein with peptidoglycan-binding domain
MYGRGVDALGDGPMYGPSMSSGQVYTDKATITAVQKKLASIGYFNGVVDGKFGSVTEAALFNFSGQHGPPDGAVITKLFDGRNGPADWALLKRLGLSSPAASPMVFEPDVVTLPSATASAPSVLPPLVPAPSAAASPLASFSSLFAAPSPATASAPQYSMNGKRVTKEEFEKSMRFWNREAFAGLPVWKVAAGAGGTLALLGLAFLAFRPRAVSSKGH